MSLSQNQMEMLQKSEEGKDGMTVIKLGFVYSKIRELEEEIARLNVFVGKVSSTFQVHKFGGEIVQFNTLEEAKEAAEVCGFEITEVVSRKVER